MTNGYHEAIQTMQIISESQVAHSNLSALYCHMQWPTSWWKVVIKCFEILLKKSNVLIAFFSFFLSFSGWIYQFSNR